MKRKILIILSNRLDRNAKVRFIELECKDNGDIVSERILRGQPRKPVYDEVWENDDGRTSFSSCNRFKRRYRHPLETRPQPTDGKRGVPRKTVKQPEPPCGK
jgi:hypothetical protein